MKTFEELLKLTDNGECEQKVEENVNEIQACVEQVLFEYGFEEDIPGEYSDSYYFIQIDNDVYYEIYEDGKFRDYLSWIELIENFDHYSTNYKQKVATDKINKVLKDFQNLYEKYGVIDFRSEGEVHMRKSEFLELFSEWNTISRCDSVYKYQLQTWVDGVLYFCLSKTEEV